MKFAKRPSSAKELAFRPSRATPVNQRRTISPVGRLHLHGSTCIPRASSAASRRPATPWRQRDDHDLAQEWRVSSQTYEEVAQDDFESDSERGVTEESDASSSSDNESRESTRSTSGPSLRHVPRRVPDHDIGTHWHPEDAVRQRSAEQSREITEKASARVRREHKVSVKIETNSGVEDRSAKTFTIPRTTPCGSTTTGRCGMEDGSPSVRASSDI